MSAVEPRYGLDDFNDIAHDPGPEENGWPLDPDDLEVFPTVAPAIRVVSLPEFVTTVDDVTEPLIGTPDETLLPANGLLLMYGDGGAGKTTLSIDALAHLAAGQDWLGIPVPAQLRVLLIENEGPRGPFRQRLAQKIAAWASEPFEHHVSVLEEPWSLFTLTEPGYRAALGSEIERTQTDVVIVGPLASLGAKGTGTPDEINEFSVLVNDLRAHAGRPFALWIVHHENKAGDVSGAWERYPDTLVHVSAQGNGRTRVHWRKVRWSSELHNTSVELTWTAGSGFDVEEKTERDYETEILTAFKDSPPAWRTMTEAKALIGAGQQATVDALDQLTQKGDLTFQIGPPGRKTHARCWHLTTYLAASGKFGSVGPQGVLSPSTYLLTSPLRGGKEVGELDPEIPTNPDEPGKLETSSEDGIPF